MKKNPQLNILSQNIILECHFFEMSRKSNQDMTLTFPKNLEKSYYLIQEVHRFKQLIYENGFTSTYILSINSDIDDPNLRISRA